MTLLVVGIAFALAAYYPLALLARSNWNLNSAGRSQLVFSVIVAVVLGLVVLRQLGLALPDWMRGVVYGIIAFGLAVQDVTLTRIQNRRSARLAREREEIRP